MQASIELRRLPDDDIDWTRDARGFAIERAGLQFLSRCAVGNHDQEVEIAIRTSLSARLRTEQIDP